MKKHVVKYPGSIKKALLTMEEMKKYRAYSIVSKAGLPEGTLFDCLTSVNEEEFGHTSFTILLPSGEAFSGFAVKRYGDNDDPEAAGCIAAGRAVAVWKAQIIRNPLNLIYKEALQKIFGVDVGDVISAEKSVEALPGLRRGRVTHTIVTTG